MPSPISKNLFACTGHGYGASGPSADPHNTAQLCFMHLSFNKVCFKSSLSATHSVTLFHMPFPLPRTRPLFLCPSIKPSKTRKPAKICCSCLGLRPSLASPSGSEWHCPTLHLTTGSSEREFFGSWCSCDLGSPGKTKSSLRAGAGSSRSLVSPRQGSAHSGRS